MLTADGTTVEDDVTWLRALAHPVRWEILDQLRKGSPMTATQLAPLVGHSPSSCSYHLRVLAQYALVTDVPASGRSRPWRATEFGLDLNPGAHSHSALAHHLRQRALTYIQTWHSEHESNPPPHIESEWDLRMTPEDLARLDATLRATIADFITSVSPSSSSTPTRVLLWALPEHESDI